MVHTIEDTLADEDHTAVEKSWWCEDKPTVIYFINFLLKITHL